MARTDLLLPTSKLILAPGKTTSPLNATAGIVRAAERAVIKTITPI